MARLTTLLLVLASVLGWAWPARAGSAEEIAIERAHALRLAEATEWLRLLVYQPRLEGGFVSQVDDDAFYLSTEGRVQPGAELDALLRAAFRPSPAGDEHAVCRFPARWAWLKETLDLRRAPPHNCPKLDAFYRDLRPESVALVFAANYLANPASAFGHTFLRMRRRSGDIGVNYAAATDTKNPALYAFKGLFGLFPGYFTYEPYEAMLAHYAGHEARDLWEYELALTPRELDLLVYHLWELSHVRVHYLYLTENCSYHVLAVIEAASPQRDLLSRLKLVVVPSDTVKAVMAQPGLVRSVVHRPSSRPMPNPTPPDRSHGSTRVTVGTGATTQYGSGFGTLGFRLVMHDMADPPGGISELIQLQFLDTVLRFDYGRRSLTLDRLTFAEIVALNPQKLSWRVRGFGERLHDRACPDCFHHGVDGGVGLTLATRDQRLAWFALASAQVGFAGGKGGVGGSFVRLGAGPFTGVRARVAGDVIGLITASVSYLPLQDLSVTYDLRATVRAPVAPNVALGFEAAKQPLSAEAYFASYIYF